MWLHRTECNGLVGLLGRALASGIGAIEARLETAWVLKLVGVNSAA